MAWCDAPTAQRQGVAGRKVLQAAILAISRSHFTCPRASICAPLLRVLTRGMTRWLLTSSLVPLMVATLSGAVCAETPSTTASNPGSSPSATKTAPKPTPLKAKIAAVKPVVTTAKKPQSAEDKKPAAQDAEEAGAFANALGSDSWAGGGSMGHRSAAANTGVLAALADQPMNTSVSNVATPNVCTEQLIGKPCPSDAMQKPLTGTTTCAVHAIGDAPLDAASMQRKIEAAYLAGVRRCAKGKLQGSLVASKTTLSFAVNAKGIVVDVTSAGADKAVADCVSKMAASWRFAAAKTAEQAAPRVEVVVETKP